jgi:hypothetical protein
MGRRSTAVAWSMLAIDVASVGVGYVLMVVNGIFQDAPANQLGLLLAFSAFMVVGVIIVARRPDNTIGWIFSAIGLLVGTGLPAWQYAEYAYATRGGALPGAILGAWYTPLWFYSAISLGFVFIPCCFPPAGCCRPAGAPSPCSPRPPPPRSSSSAPSSCRPRAPASTIPSASPAFRTQTAAGWAIC